MVNFCERLNELKLTKNLLQKDIAKDVNLSLRAYQYYERGERQPDRKSVV